MRVFIAHSFKHREEQKEMLDAVAAAIEAAGHEAYLFTRAYQSFGKGEEKTMMAAALREISSAGLLVAELTTKEIGVGLEVGIAAAKGIPVMYLRERGADYSSTVGGVADYTIEYGSPAEAAEAVSAVLAPQNSL